MAGATVDRPLRRFPRGRGGGRIRARARGPSNGREPRSGQRVRSPATLAGRLGASFGTRLAVSGCPPAIRGDTQRTAVGAAEKLGRAGLDAYSRGRRRSVRGVPAVARVRG